MLIFVIFTVHLRRIHDLFEDNSSNWAYIWLVRHIFWVSDSERYVWKCSWLDPHCLPVDYLFLGVNSNWSKYWDRWPVQNFNFWWVRNLIRLKVDRWNIRRLNKVDWQSIYFFLCWSCLEEFTPHRSKFLYVKKKNFPTTMESNEWSTIIFHYSYYLLLAETTSSERGWETGKRVFLLGGVFNHTVFIVS